MLWLSEIYEKNISTKVSVFLLLACGSKVTKKSKIGKWIRSGNRSFAPFITKNKFHVMDFRMYRSVRIYKHKIYRYIQDVICYSNKQYYVYFNAFKRCVTYFGLFLLLAPAYFYTPPAPWPRHFPDWVCEDNEFLYRSPKISSSNHSWPAARCSPSRQWCRYSSTESNPTRTWRGRPFWKTNRPFWQTSGRCSSRIACSIHNPTRS